MILHINAKDLEDEATLTLATFASRVRSEFLWLKGNPETHRLKHLSAGSHLCSDAAAQVVGLELNKFHTGITVWD